LNVPEGDIVAELVLTMTAKAITYAEMCCYSVIAVTSPAGLAFGSWMSCETNKMWLKDFLPYDIRNIRIMSYGYDGRLVGQGESENRLLDYQRLFVQDIRNPSHKHIIDATYSIIFFGTPHQGMPTYALEELVHCETSRHNFLEGSEFLEDQKDQLSYIWNEYKPKIISFYETAPTFRVQWVRL
jgi:hypothetical protein